MTDAVVTQLHPALAEGETARRKSKDVTGALRSRRARQKRKAAVKPANMPVAHPYENPNKNRADDTVPRAHPASIPDVSPRWMPWSVWPLAGTTVGLMAVSLTHLSDGVTQLTAITSWQAWAMAVGIDCMLISVALAQLTAPAAVKRDIATVARCMEAGTLVMSAGLNALAFTGGAFDAAHWAQIAFGCFVPAAISGLRISWPDLRGADFDLAGAGSPPAFFKSAAGYRGSVCRAAHQTVAGWTLSAR